MLVREDLSLSLNLSVNSLSMPQESAHYALGDSVAQLKYRVTPIDKKLQIALIPEIYLPLGSKEDYLSTGQPGAAFRVAGMRQYGRFKLASNIGYRYLPGATLGNLDYRKQVIAGLSSEILLTEKFSLNLEGVGFFSTPYKSTNSTGEIYLGGLFALSQLTTITAGLSRSGVTDADNQSFRGIIGLKTYFDDAQPKSKSAPPQIAAAFPMPKRSACFTEAQNNTFHSRPLTGEEAQRIYGNLPYVAKTKASYRGSAVQIKTLKYGEMTGTTSDGFPYVKDSQIPFAIDLSGIPEFKRIKEINHAWLKMRVNKLSQDGHLGTELFCSLNFKICSGETIERDKWGSIFNPRFFNSDKRIYNNNFSRQYLDNPVAKFNGENLYSKLLTLPLQDVVQGSHVQVRHFFQNAKDGKKTLYFVVADDTFLSNEISLEVSMGVERCYTER